MTTYHTCPECLEQWGPRAYCYDCDRPINGSEESRQWDMAYEMAAGK